MKYAMLRLITAVCFILLTQTACNTRKSAPPSQFFLLNESVLTSNELKGKVWLLNFWATSCATCVKEMPAFQKIYLEYQPKGLEIIAVAMSYDNPEYVEKFQKQKGLPFKVALDKNGTNSKKWGNIEITPTTFLIDKHGNIVQTTVGEPDFKRLKEKLNKLLKP